VTRVTVLLSVYNGERYVGEAIDSILGPTYRDFELLVIDDCSTDRTPQILASYADPRIRVIRNATNRGLTKSLNLGLAEARGELIARHDDDDRSLPRRLEAQVAHLDAHPELALLGTQANVIDAQGRRRRTLTARKPLTPRACDFSLMFATPMVHGAVMFRRAIVRDALGGYDESFITSQDVELWARVAAGGWPMANLPEALVEHRVHAGSVAATSYNRDNLLRVLPLLERNVVRIAGSRELAEEWARLWMSVVNRHAFPPPENGARTLEVLDALRDAFLRRDPDGWRDPEVRKVYGGAMLLVAQCEASGHRARAARAFGRALRHHAAAALPALPHIAAYALLGERARMLRKVRA
jgi:glycosyltransferase involved in cell wall biosynthesis